jgi:hypothetical protein
MRERGYDMSPVEVDARALVQEQYKRHVEATVAARKRLMG